MDGVYFECTGDGASILITPVTYSNSVLGTGTGTAPNAYSNTLWYKFVIVINDTATQANFYIYTNASGPDAFDDLIMEWTIASNVPTGTGRETSCGVKAWRTNSTTTTLMYVDRIDYYNTLPIR